MTTPSHAAALLAELGHEAGTTRRLLAAVPAERFDWTPHPRSFSLRRLAGHTAEIPGRISAMLAEPTLDFATVGGVDEPASVEDLLAAFDAGVAAATQRLANWTRDDLAATWTAFAGDRTILELPRAAAVRTLLLNHLYHHRGQLTVYLRLLDVPVPSVYGPTADDNPFA